MTQDVNGRNPWCVRGGSRDVIVARWTLERFEYLIEELDPRAR